MIDSEQIAIAAQKGGSQPCPCRKTTKNTLPKHSCPTCHGCGAFHVCSVCDGTGARKGASAYGDPSCGKCGGRGTFPDKPRLKKTGRSRERS